MENPYIILVGGATGVGTSSVAAKLSSIYPVRGFQRTDCIRQVMRTVVGPLLCPEVFQSTYTAHEAFESVYDDPKLMPLGRVLFGHLKQCESVMLGLDGAISRDVREGINSIYEGIHILPGKFGEKSRYEKESRVKMARSLSDLGVILLNPEDYAKHFIEFVIDIENPEVHKKRFLLREKYAPNRPSEKYLSNFDKIRKIRNFIIEMAKTNNIPIVQNDCLDDAVKECMEIITKKAEGKLIPIK